MNADLYDLFESGTGFQNPLTSASSASSGMASGGTSGLNSINSTGNQQIRDALNAGGLSPSRIDTGLGAMGLATSGVGTLVTYGDRSVSEAFSRINTTTAYSNGLNVIGRPLTSCDTVNSAFGVIQQKGAEWLAKMESALASVTAKIAELEALVNEGISAGLAKIQQLADEVNGLIDEAMESINEVIQEITDGIAAELAELEKMVRSCVNFCMAHIMPDWLKDSCVAGAIQKMATPELKAALG